MSHQYEGFEDVCGKMFTIEDVDVKGRDVTPEQQQQPTAAQFMASITVRVATNMVIAAQARGRPRQPARPDLEDLDAPELDVPAVRRVEHVDSVDGPPAGEGPVPCDEMQAEELSKLTQPLHAISDEALLRVVRHDEMGCASMLRGYKETFLQTVPRSRCDSDAAARCTGRHDGASLAR